MRTVHKFEFGYEAQVHIPWPEGARVVLVAQQATTYPTLWVEYDTDLIDGAPQRWFRVRGTGHPLIATEKHVGSAVCGSFVWHVYAEAVE